MAAKAVGSYCYAWRNCRSDWCDVCNLLDPDPSASTNSFDNQNSFLLGWCLLCCHAGLASDPCSSLGSVVRICVAAGKEDAVKLWLLYVLLLKATCTTFAGLASLPVLRSDLVLHHHWLTDQQLNTAVVVTRTTPGPAGLYIVSVGYLIGGISGAIVAWLAMVTPALFVIPLLKFAGNKAQHPRVKGVLQAVVLSSAGLLGASAFPMAREAATDVFTIGLLIVSVLVLLTRKVESVWVVLSAAMIELAASSVHLVK